MFGFCESLVVVVLQLAARCRELRGWWGSGKIPTVEL